MSFPQEHAFLSALDSRYWDASVAEYLSDEATLNYRLRVEAALATVLTRRGICKTDVGKEITDACKLISLADVRTEEERVHHDIRALVNCLRSRISADARPYVHLTATSADIVDTARALSFKDAANHTLLPTLKQLLTTLIALLRREAHTVQIGRTHGQHAVPLTFGLAIAGYVSRLGGCITSLQKLTNELRGECSGAVGAHNAASLLVDDPEEFEHEVLTELGLEPAEHSTQVVPLEATIRFFSEIVLTMGVLANIADDMRHLGRTEIGEVGEYFGDNQVGSSTMPQKKNPISFENVKSMWKIITLRLTTLFMDQISEHQRDLTSSASARTYGEIIAYAVTATKRLAGALSKLSVDQKRMKENLAYEQDLITAEPLYIILSTLGHQDAHEKVRTLSLAARKQKCSLQKIVEQDPELAPYRARMSPEQLSVLQNPQSYIGSSVHKALAIALRWEKELELT